MIFAPKKIFTQILHYYQNLNIFKVWNSSQIVTIKIMDPKKRTTKNGQKNTEVTAKILSKFEKVKKQLKMMTVHEFWCKMPTMQGNPNMERQVLTW